MMKTIFKKLILVFTSILLIAFIITGIILNLFLSDFVSSEKEKVLKQSAEQIKTAFGEYYNLGDAQAYTSFFFNMLNFYKTTTNSIIWIVDTDGNLAYPVGAVGLPKELYNKFKINNGKLQLPDEKQYKGIVQQDTIIKEVGDFYGLFSDTGVDWLTIEKTLTFTDSKGAVHIIGAVYLNSQIPDVQKIKTTIIGFFIISCLISILISIIIAFFFSKRISKPLKELNQIAKQVSNGDFYKRVNTKSRDEIGELSASFNNMVDALENLEQMRRDFIANVSHELRTPLTSIRGFVEGILDGTIPPEKHQFYLNIVNEETQRINRLVNDVLELAMLQSKEVVLTITDFDINELIRNTILKFDSRIVSGDFKIEARFDSEFIIVSADEDAIERVIINLIDNAIKFSLPGGLITIATKIDKDKVNISISDTGKGIKPDELNMVFERFYKSDKSRRKSTKGTGLGLAIVKNIINEHGQSIGVESEYGSGTTFTFTLPLAEIDEN
jgi:signal transduction histidine kinase